MARSEAGAQLTDRHRQAQAAISASALRDFLRLWPLWQIEDQARQQREDRSFAAMVAATIILIRAYHQASATLAAAYFTSFRSVEQVGGFAAPRLAEPIDAERVTSSLYVTGRVMTSKALQAGQPPQKARETAFVRTSGAVTRHVLQGGRDTIVMSTGEDPKAQKWARVTRGTPCAFCAAIASRGAVFLGHDTAEFQAHDHCNCTAEPHYEGSAMPVDSERWRDLYNQAQREARENDDLKRGTANDPLNAFRRALAAH